MAIQKLMRQKINVSPIMLFEWKRNMEFNLRCLIHKHLLSKNDYQSEFIHQGRTFTIVGMTEMEHVIVEEIFEGEKYYWECTAEFAQMKLGRFYTEWKIINGIRIAVNAPYEDRKLYLPINRIQRKKKEEVEETEDPIMETYVEDIHEEESL
jgi:hypothetical protein